MASRAITVTVDTSRLRGQLREACEIVLRVASPDYRPYDGEQGRCTFCGTEDPSPFVVVDDDHLAHDEQCPWRRARLWAAAQADGGTRAGA